MMRTAVVSAAAVLVAAAVFARFGGTLPVPQPADTMQYVVSIEVPGGSESGVVVRTSAKGSLILTCAHGVTKDFTAAAVANVFVVKNGLPTAGKVIKVDTKLDLALVQVGEQWAASPEIDGEAIPGEVELVVGHPLDEQLSITQGFISSHDAQGLPKTEDVEEAERHVSALQGTAAVWPGNSGGGVFVDHGGWKLAGIAEFIRSFNIGGGMMPMPGLASTVSFFIPMKNVRMFLEGVSV